MTNTVNKHLNNTKSSFKSASFYLKLAIVALLVLFIVCPLISIFTNMRSADFQYVFTSQKFWLSILYSILYSAIGSLIAVVLATLSAYMLSRSNIKGKQIFAVLLTMPMLIPTISIGLGIKNIFGVAHLGFLPLVIGSIITSFPVAFLLLSDAMQYEDKSIYDAALTLGVTKRLSFFKITLPYLKKTLITAFIASSVWVFTDYGLPLEVAGNIPTLPVFLYDQAIGLFQYGRGSIVGIFLILPSIFSFAFSNSKDSASGTSREQIIKQPRKFNVISTISLILISLIICLPQIMFLVIAFTKNYPNDMSFTFDNFRNAFSVGGATNIWGRIANSLLLSFFTGVFGCLLAYLCAYSSTRSKGFLSKAIDFLSNITIAIPGLVLGLGFVVLFSFSKGWFYGTLAILVAVNIIHFFGSPYLMAKNALSKLDKDYEKVGQTLNASKFSVFWNVLLPNSFSTVIRMFSYFFINSMITISAIAFLAEYYNVPLSLEIARYDTTANYQMQAVISIVILLINIVAKIGLEGLASMVEKQTMKVSDTTISLTHNEFRVVNYVINNQKEDGVTRNDIFKNVKQSRSTINGVLKALLSEKILEMNKKNLYMVSKHGTVVMEQYRVRKAIIIAAGFGSRMVPVTLDTPKPLVKVNGKRIIDTLLDALYEKDIKNIYVIRGYLGEQFDELLEKYPTIKFIENPLYNEANNISSIYAAREYLDRCYICEADLVVNNPDIIAKYQYRTNYLGIPVETTEDWCFHMDKHGRYIDSVSIGGENVIQMVGISYWSQKDADQLKIDVPKAFESHGGKENYWDNVPLKIKKKNYNISIRKCKKEDVMEIDNFSELVAIDKSYKGYVAKKNSK